MPTYNVIIKWGSHKHAVDANTDEVPMLFKAQLYALTGVQPERQKILFKGRALSDDSWNNFDIKDGTQLMMMGSADSVPSGPAVKPTFLEDLSEGQRHKALDLRTGLKNLGNTCYMNATLQCLKSVPELEDALRRFNGRIASGPMSSDGAQSIVAAMRDLFNTMDQTHQEETVPLLMVSVLHMVFPRFAEKDDHNQLQQQDANECWVELMRMLQQKLQLPVSSNVEAPAAAAASERARAFISQYFGIRLQSTMTCKDPEAVNESPTHDSEELLQLSCYLSQDVRYLQSGLKAKMIEEITKNSPTLNRDAVYQRCTLLNRLPAYLTIQLVRFYYKEKDRVNAKILKDVKFSINLDVYELCTPELQHKLTPMRNKFKDQDEILLELKSKNVLFSEEELVAYENKPKQRHPFSFADDVGSNNSGFYELIAVLTHKGRSSNSGHYVAWVRKGDRWIMCDDDVVGPVTTDDIMKLSGGGDWHCAYLLLYGPKVLETPIEDVHSESKNGETAPSA